MRRILYDSHVTTYVVLLSILISFAVCILFLCGAILGEFYYTLLELGLLVMCTVLIGE